MIIKTGSIRAVSQRLNDHDSEPLTWENPVSEERVAPYVHACHHGRTGSRGLAVSAGAGRWIRWTTIGCMALLALIAGTVSYLHMHMLVARHGQPGWVAALTPFSVDGMIVAASTTLLADSRSGGKGGVLPWALLVAGSVASLAANVAVAENAGQAGAFGPAATVGTGSADDGAGGEAMARPEGAQ
jgi:hypothetical protein